MAGDAGLDPSPSTDSEYPAEHHAAAPAGNCGCGRVVRTAADSRARGAGSFPLLCAFRCAARGIAYAFATQRNLKIQLACALAAVAAGLVLGISRAEWLAIAGAITIVAATEVVNTAVESVTDLASPDWHPLARAAKDAGAGAVLLASIGAAVIGLIVFVPHLPALLP